MTQMFHTSPEKIEKIRSTGMAGDCLFFSSGLYSMGRCNFVYEADFECIDVDDLEDNTNSDIVAEIAEMFNTDQDTAFDLLCARESEFDLGADAEKSWWLQGKRGEAAKNQGFDGCEDTDEQGTVYIIPMFGREADLYECSKDEDGEWIDSEGDSIY